MTLYERLAVASDGQTSVTRQRRKRYARQLLPFGAAVNEKVRENMEQLRVQNLGVHAVEMVVHPEARRWDAIKYFAEVVGNAREHETPDECTLEYSSSSLGVGESMNCVVEVQIHTMRGAFEAAL